MSETEPTQNTPQASTPPVEKKDNTKLIVGIVIVVIVLYGVKSMMYSPERAVERAMERAMGERGIDVDIDRGGRGDTTATFKGDDGEEYTMNAGADVPLPENWPKDVPLVDDAKITYAGSMMGGQAGGGVNIAYTTKQSVNEVNEYYTRVLVSNGYTIATKMATPEGTMLAATKDETKNVMVYTGTSPEGTTVTITAQSAQ